MWKLVIDMQLLLNHWKKAFTLIEISIAFLLIGVIIGTLILIVAETTENINMQRLLIGHRQLVSTLTGSLSKTFISDGNYTLSKDKVYDLIVKNNILPQPYYINPEKCGTDRFAVTGLNICVSVFANVGLYVSGGEGRLIVIRYDNITNGQVHKLYQSEIDTYCADGLLFPIRQIVVDYTPSVIIVNDCSNSSNIIPVDDPNAISGYMYIKYNIPLM